MPMTSNTRKWLFGLLAAIINGAASGVTVIVVDPIDFNIFDGGAAKLGVVCLVSALFGGASYLKTNPVPPESGE